MLKVIAAMLLFSACLAWAGCRVSSELTQRLATLAAPPLARTSGGSYATTDTYLRTLGIASPSLRVLAAVSPLPKEDAILFVAPAPDLAPALDDAETELTYRTIASLSWPHEVGALHCRFGGLSGANTVPPTLLFRPRAEKKIRWLLLYQVPPPASSPITAEIGPHLKLIPIEETSRKEAGAWTSYCSR